MPEIICGKNKPVTVVIRSYNEMPNTPATLEWLFRQRFTDFDVIAVDSGSTDGSVEVFKEWRDRVKDKFDFHFIQIPKSEYQHGRTLNMAIGKTRAKVAVLLNADATPVDEYWLERLIAPFDKDEKVAATFSRQLPRPGTKPLFVFDTERFFPPEKKPYNWKYMIHYSQSASAIRHGLWEERPYYTSAYTSEDEEWARYWIDRGYRIEYVPDSLAMHSHNYTLKQLWKRHTGEGEAAVFIFGTKPSFKGQFLRWLRCLFKDTLYFLTHGHIGWIFYGPIYRAVMCHAYHKGTKIGMKKRQAAATGR